MEKSAFILNDNGNLNQAIINYENNEISIRMFDVNYELLGYMNLFIQKNNRILLSEIYCYDKYRGSNIASIISELADYLLKDYRDYVIRGRFYPSQMSSDILSYPRSKEELDLRARNFYIKNGYKILSLDEFLKNKEEYSFINDEYDFTYNGGKTNTIVYKVIKDKDYNFYEQDGLIYYNNSKSVNR